MILRDEDGQKIKYSSLYIYPSYPEWGRENPAPTILENGISGIILYS
jgi:hypothetical protein